GRLWINTGGSPGLGTSGSGDVLAGVIAGLAAHGATPEQAAAWGVHLHAQAGARLSHRFGEVGFLAREIAGEVTMLMQDLSGGNTEPGPCAPACSPTPTASSAPRRSPPWRAAAIWSTPATSASRRC